MWFTNDALGRLGTQDIVNDDNSHIFYNWDQASTEAFTFVADLYDSGGHYYQQVIRFDDGSTSYTAF